MALAVATQFPKPCFSTFVHLLFNVEPTCRHETYTQQGGNLVGYLSFALLIALGLIAIWGSRRPTVQEARRILWDVGLASLAICLLTVWGLGLTFVPGSLLIFL